MSHLITGANRDLIELQMELASTLRTRMERELGTSGDMDSYYGDYRCHFPDFQVISYKAELIYRMVRSNLVYIGDFHTLRQAKKTVIRLLHELEPRPHEIILCTEAVCIDHQPILDAYLSGRKSEAQFLAEVKYEKTWGFEWAQYQVLFDYAREHAIRVVALNTQPDHAEGRLQYRDQRAAAVIADLTEQHPEALIVVFIGDLHICPDHLPRDVEQALAKRELSRKRLIIYQNSEMVYWKLAEQGLEHHVDVVKMAADEFCVMNCTPLIKYQSYLNWVDQKEELEVLGDDAWEFQRGLSYFDQIAETIQIICDFLEIPVVDRDGYQVQTSSNLEFIRWLSEDPRFTQEELDYFRLHLKKAKNLFIPRAGIIYLPVLSVNYAAEEATHYIIHMCRGLQMSPKSDFYLDIIDKALGYFGSKIINHKRFCKKAEDFRAIVETLSPRDDLSPVEEDHLRFGREILLHLEMEEQYAKKGHLPEVPQHFLDDLALRIDLTRALGYRLGDKMFEAVMTGGPQPLLTKGNVRNLICTPFDHLMEPTRTYFDLVYRMHPLKDARKSKRDYL